MFLEYTMASEENLMSILDLQNRDRWSCKYLKICEIPAITREQLRLWYDGYTTKAGERMYNPRSVLLFPIIILKLLDEFRSVWWDFYYIKNNVADVKADLALMVAGEAVQAKVREYMQHQWIYRQRMKFFSDGCIWILELWEWKSKNS